MGVGRTAGLALVGLFASGSVASVPAQAQTESNPAPTQANQSAAGDPAQGQKYFEQAGCGWCHAEAGHAAGKGPKLEGSERTDSFITFRIKHGKEGAMPAFGGTFNDKQIADILAYIRSLKG
jgi:mono/diheme cytochrome c family protein